VSNGFRFQDAPWQRRLLYDDPRLHETLDWLVSLNRRGVSATPEAMGKLGSESMFTTARVAMIPTGSWMVGFFSRNTRFAHAFVPLPRGPLGFRASMFNGLAHSIWKGSKHQADAWRWVKYLGSDACQAVVARYGVVYPAVRGLSVVAAQVQIRNGANPKAFFDMAQSHTFAPPIADHVAQITDIINGAAERAFLGQATAADAMTNANAKANAVLAR
jgi:multiple sugar transport system substrate-binding protein